MVRRIQVFLFFHMLSDRLVSALHDYVLYTRSRRMKRLGRDVRRVRLETGRLDLDIVFA
jgi:hypothetical protein